MLLGVVLIVARAPGPVLAVALIPVEYLAWLYFLLRGVRWLWFVTLGIYLLVIPMILSGSITWEGYLSTAVGVVLLLMPGTRKFFSNRTSYQR
jgi:hypothetical protein